MSEEEAKESNLSVEIELPKVDVGVPERKLHKVEGPIYIKAGEPLPDKLMKEVSFPIVAEHAEGKIAPFVRTPAEAGIFVPKEKVVAQKKKVKEPKEFKTVRKAIKHAKIKEEKPKEKSLLGKIKNKVVKKSKTK